MIAGRQLRGDAFGVVPKVVDQEVLLIVTNDGPTAKFTAQLTETSGLRENIPTPFNLAWRKFDGEAKEILQGQSQLLSVAEGAAEVDPKAQVRQFGRWTFHALGESFQTHMADLLTTEAVFEKEVEATIAVRRLDTSRTVTAAVRIGFLKHEHDRRGVIDFRERGSFQIRARVGP